VSARRAFMLFEADCAKRSDKTWGKILAHLQLISSAPRDLFLVERWQDTVKALREYYLQHFLRPEDGTAKFRNVSSEHYSRWSPVRDGVLLTASFLAKKAGKDALRSTAITESAEQARVQPVEASASNSTASSLLRTVPGLSVGPLPPPSVTKRPSSPTHCESPMEPRVETTREIGWPIENLVNGSGVLGVHPPPQTKSPEILTLPAEDPPQAKNTVIEDEQSHGPREAHVPGWSLSRWWLKRF
jgi:hypothetical protein